MKIYEKIKQLDLESMASLFAWGTDNNGLNVPNCRNTCTDFTNECFRTCNYEKRQKVFVEWLEMEASK